MLATVLAGIATGWLLRLVGPAAKRNDWLHLPNVLWRDVAGAAGKIDERPAR